MRKKSKLTIHYKNLGSLCFQKIPLNIYYLKIPFKTVRNYFFQDSL